MTPTELRRAAQDTLNLCLPWDSKEEHYCFPEDSWTDVETLCKHILSTVREDDGEQVNRKHLEGLGFYRPMQVASADCYVWPSEDTTAPKSPTYTPMVSVEFVRGKFGVLTTIVSVYGYAKEYRIYTVGQLRRLLEGLGIA